MKKRRKQHENSKETFVKKVKPELSKKQAQILSLIIQYPRLCIKEYAGILEVHPNDISGRFTELKSEKKRKIIEVGKKYIDSKPNAVWETVKINSQNQISLF